MIKHILIFFALITFAQAKITRVEITKREPAFAGASFGMVGAYERLQGKAYGEVSPFHRDNRIIQDLSLAPRNARGMVEYVTDIDILRPVDLTKGNKTFLVEIHNRGRKLLQGSTLLNLKGDQVDHLYPAYDFPFSYARQHDPLTGRKQGVLDRCKESGTCPKIFHVTTALEVWEGRQSLGLTDPLAFGQCQQLLNKPPQIL